MRAARARPLCCIRPTCWNAACNGTLQAGMVTAMRERSSRLGRKSPGIPGVGSMRQFRFAMDEPYLATMTWERSDMPVPVQGEPAGRPTLAALRAMRGKILDAASRRGLDDVRVFGSVARGEAGETSDVDLLVAPGPRTTLFDLSGFALDVEEIVGRHVDVATPRGLKARIRDHVLAEAVAL